MRTAVVLTTYCWDDFVERQVRRLDAVKGSADLFVLADETRGARFPTAPNIIVTSEKEIARSLDLTLLKEAGWGHGPLLWWNLDCLTYRFFHDHPEYDACLTLDYDACLNVDVDRLFSRMRDTQAALIAERIADTLDAWYWTEPHRGYCARSEIEGRLLCVAALTREAAHHLLTRRRELATAYRNGSVAFWPFCEVFVPVELRRAGLRIASLSDYGSTQAYGYRPPHWEGDRAPDHAFVHPVLDTQRYLRAITREHPTLTDALRPTTPFGRELRRFPFRDTAPHLWREARRRVPLKLAR